MCCEKSGGGTDQGKQEAWQGDRIRGGRRRREVDKRYVIETSPEGKVRVCQLGDGGKMQARWEKYWHDDDVS